MLRTLAILPAVALLMLWPGLLAADDVKRPAKPNILFIFTDDQAPDTIAALGNPAVKTPNLDRLVESGCTFTHTYNMGSWSGAVCVASRTMLNTGRFVWNAQRLNMKQRIADRQTWGQLMADAGYRTYMAGKWHVPGADAGQIFHHTQHVRPGMPRQTNAGYNRPIEGQPDKWQPWDRSHGGFWEGGKHWSEVLVDDATEFFAKARDDDRPFFMYLAFNAPHDPRQSPKEYVEMYPWKELKLPESFQPKYPFAEQIGCGPGLRDEKLAPFPRTEYAAKVNRSEYYALVSHTDAMIGRILKLLEESGQADNTYIIFTADHGLAVGHHGLMGKQNMHWHSVRVPLVVAGPTIEPGRKIATRVYLQDAMPTALELAGATEPKDVQFQSLLPLIDRRWSKHYDHIYGGYLNLQRMIISEDFKLILYPNVPTTRLYNLKEDPHELNDLAGDPASIMVQQQLFRRFQKLQEQTGDQLDLTKAFPHLAP